MASEIIEPFEKDESIQFWQLAALRQQIYDFLCREMQNHECYDPIEALSPQVSPTLFGFDALDFLEVLELTKEEFNVDWHLDYQGTEKVYSLPLEQIVTWVEQRIAGL